MELSDIYIPPTPAQERDALRAEVERLRAKCDDLTINGFSSQLRQLDDLRKENARLKEVVAGYHGSGQRIQDLSDDCGLLESTNKALGAEVERLRHADAEVERLRPLLESERKFRLEAENSLGEERELVKRLRSDLEHERQLHRDAAAEVERLRPTAVAHPCAIAEIERLQAEVERLQAKFADQAACLAAADADRIRLIAEVERLQARDAEWAQKAATWMASPEAAQRLDGYRTLAAEVERLRELQNETENLRTELDAVLSDWSAIVKASGSPTNGAAIGYVAAMRAEVERLRAETDQLNKQILDHSADKLRLSMMLKTETDLRKQRDTEIDYLREVGEGLRAERQWHPMETAPRTLDDRLLLLRDGRVRIGWWCASESWAFCEAGSLNACIVRADDSEVMGWLPLPKPPEQKS